MSERVVHSLSTRFALVDVVVIGRCQNPLRRRLCSFQLKPSPGSVVVGGVGLGGEEEMKKIVRKCET